MVPEERADAWSALATDVRAVLRRAGLRCVEDAAPGEAPGGVRVEVDSGVYVAWSASRALKDEARAALRRQDTDDPAYRLFGAAGEAMGTALLRILETAGFQATMDTTTPYVVEVRAS